MKSLVRCLTTCCAVMVMAGCLSPYSAAYSRYESMMSSGQQYEDTRKFHEAEQVYTDALRLAEESLSLRSVGRTSWCLAEVKLQLKKYAEAQRYFSKALTAAEHEVKSTQDPWWRSQVGGLLYLKAITYHLQKRYRAGVPTVKRMLPYLDDINREYPGLIQGKSEPWVGVLDHGYPSVASFLDTYSRAVRNADPRSAAFLATKAKEVRRKYH